ncbi:hypothetical protein SKB0120_25270 (plasmid) [Moraxella osloensis]|jgi:hypothetical protein|nr:hypothetical protein [Moraxella osloensis]MBW4017243.1 hypothetical protein [Moraxella osloensis]ONG38685.1 hypothetical protein BKE17_07330 [Enhydrobacter sp. H5]
MTEKTSLSDKELEEFIEFVNKFKTYTKPTNRQKELINHYEFGYLNDHLDEINIKMIKRIILAERRNKLAKEADAKYRKLLKKQNENKVKSNNHIRFETGGALLGLIKKNAMFNDTLSYADVLIKLIQLKKIDEYDKNGNWLFGDYLPEPVAPFVPPAPTVQAVENPATVNTNLPIKDHSHIFELDSIAPGFSHANS